MPEPSMTVGRFGTTFFWKSPVIEALRAAGKLYDPIANARAYFAAQVSKDEPKVEDQPPARVSIFVDGREVARTK